MKKGWYKYKTPVGKIYIKVSSKIEMTDSGTITMKWQRPQDDSWLYHSPDIEFKDIFDVISHITQNTETRCTKFKILSFS